MFFPAAPFIGLAASLTAWIGSALGGAAPPEPIVQRVIVRGEMVMHVPIQRRLEPRIEWIERAGPQCLPASVIAGAAMAGPSAIDFVLADRRRLRAELDSGCKGLDFYGGFYVELEDGAVCAMREEIRSRVGGSCRIDRFHRLVPQVKR